MDVKDFLGIKQVDDNRHFTLDVGSHLITPGEFLFGGCGLGAAIVALEEASGRPTIWANAQYLSYAPLNSTMEIEAVLEVEGGHVTQARAVGRVEGREILTVNSSLGTNTLEVGGVWVEPPVVKDPDDCPPRRLPHLVEHSIFQHVDVRMAKGRSYEEIDGTPGSSDSALWARLPGHVDPSAATLAIFGDFLTGAVANSVGRITMGRSLDNTIRMVQVEPTEWVLCDMRLHALVDGYAQGVVFLWSEHGTLLATASQSMAIKLWDL